VATKKYHYVGQHADTVYKGDYAIPVGHGMEPISLSDDDLADERNAHVKDSFKAVEQAQTQAETTSKAGKDGEK
jgi:hypothetical protein